MPEGTGLGAGPGWAPGRGSARGLRPFGRPRPGARPGMLSTRAWCSAVTAGDRNDCASPRCLLLAARGSGAGGCAAWSLPGVWGVRRTTRACASWHGHGGNRRHPARMRGHRGGGGEERCPGGARAHQECVDAVGAERGGQTAARGSSDCCGLSGRGWTATAMAASPGRFRDRDRKSVV